MKFITKKEDLQKALSKVTGISIKHASLPVLNCFLFEAKSGALSLRATNLNVGVEVRVRATVEQDGIFALDAQTITSVISGIKSDEFLTCSLVDSEFHIESKFRNVTIKTYPYEDFPVLPRLNSENFTCRFITNDLIDNIKKVSYAASQSDMKPEIASLYLHSKDGIFYFVCTDGYRLAEKKYRPAFETNCPSLIMPIKNIIEISRILASCDQDIEFKAYDHMVVFEDESTYITMHIVAGNYPNYETIIPKDWKQEITILKSDIVEMLRINQVFSDSLLRLSLETHKESGVVSFLSESQDKGKSKQDIEAKIDGETSEMIPLTINHKYFSDVINVLSSDSITLRITEKYL